MDGDHKQLAIQWTWEGRTLESIAETAAWLDERRRLGGGCENFFHMAAKMLLLARFDYFLITPVFFHSVIGLERALRIHYKSSEETYTRMSAGSLDSFSQLFQRAVDDELITDGLFGEVPRLDDYFDQFGEEGEAPSSHSALLALLIPKLRNEYFHGSDMLHSDFYELTIQLRQCADALKTRGVKSLVE